MSFKDVLASHDLPALIARAYSGVTYQDEPHYGVLKKLSTQVEMTLKAMISLYGEFNFDDGSSITSELSGLLKTLPVTVESLIISPLTEASPDKVDNGVMLISARMGDTEFKIAQKVMSGMDSWAVYTKKRSTLFMTHNFRASIPLGALPDIDGKSVGFSAINDNFCASKQIIEVKSVDSIKRSPFNKLVTDSLQTKRMSAEEKLYCLMDLAVKSNTESLAWDTLETGLCDEKTIKLAMKNAFQFTSPDLMFSLIKTNYSRYSELLPELYEYGYLDFRRFDRFFHAAESFSEKLVGLKSYLTPEASSQSLRVLEKAQMVYKFDEDVRSKYLSSLLKTGSKGKRSTAKI